MRACLFVYQEDLFEASLQAIHHMAWFIYSLCLFLKIYLFVFSCMWVSMTMFAPRNLGGWKMASHYLELELQMAVSDNVGIELSLGSLWQHPVHLADSPSPTHHSHLGSSPKPHSQYLVCFVFISAIYQKGKTFREVRGCLRVTGSLACIWADAAGLPSIRFGVSEHLYSVLEAEEAGVYVHLVVFAFPVDADSTLVFSSTFSCY